MGKNWMAMFDEIDGIVDAKINPYIEGIRSPSPSVNFIFGNTHLIPFGSSVIFWGPPGGGKSLICNAIIGQLHQDYPDALAFKFNTEFREQYQMTDLARKMFKIDPNRYRARNTNRPSEIFNFIEQDIATMCEKGAPIKLIIIDSITDVMGRRMSNSDDVDQQQMGDDAATLKDGLKRIKSTLRKYGITLLMVAQERAVFDEVEKKRGKHTKMAGSFYMQHFAEYFVYVAPDESKDGRQNILEEKFEDESNRDVIGNPETYAHKIKVQMKKSSVGVAKRTGEFTWHSFKGIVDIHEEIFLLGKARNIIEMPNNRTYVMKDWPENGKECKWIGKSECLMNIRENSDLQKEITNRVRLKDIELFKNGVPDQPFCAAQTPVLDDPEVISDRNDV